MNKTAECSSTTIRLAAAVAFGLIVLSSYSEGQQLEKIPRLGFLQRRMPPSADNPDPLGDAFRQGLRELGYIEGKNIFIEQRYAGGKTEIIPALVAELINSRVDLWSLPAHPRSKPPSEPLRVFQSS